MACTAFTIDPKEQLIVLSFSQVAYDLEPEDIFSSMPPIEGPKAAISHMMTEQKDPDGDDLCLAVWDVS